MSFRQFQPLSPSKRTTRFATTHKWVSIIGLSLAFVLLSLQPVRAEAVLNIVQTLIEPTGTTVFPYETVIYKVSISCSSSEDPNCDNVIISDTLDPNLEYIASTPPPGFGAPIVNGNTFTLTAPAMESGSTADLYITLRVRPTALPSATIPHTVNIKIDNGPSNVPTTFVSNGPTLTVGQPSPQWSVEKVRLKPAGIDPAVDNNVTYGLNICSDKLSGNVDLATPVVEDIYPSGAIVVSTDGGVDNGTKITWTLSTIEVLTLYPSGTAPSSKQCLTKKVVLRYPSPTYTTSSTVNNQMSLTSTTLSGPIGDTLEHGFLDPTARVRISKDSTSQQDRTNVSLAPGMLQTWKLSFDASAGNIDVVNPIITDTLPAYGVIESTHSITSGNWISTTKAYVEVSSDGTLWVPLPGSPVDGDDNKSWFSTTDFAANITHVRWRFFEEINGSEVYSVSQDFAASGLIIKQKVANTATDGQTFQNCASATAGTPAAACKTITVLDPKPELEPAKTVLNDPKPGDDVQIILAIGQGPNSSAAIVDPKMTDVISSYLEFVSWDSVTIPSGASEPYFVKTDLPDGTTRLHFYWSSNNPVANSVKLDGTPATVPNSHTIPLGPTAEDTSGRNTVSVRITLRVKESTPKGDYPNDLYTGANAPGFSCQPATGVFTETVDVDGNGANNDTLCKDSADVSVLPAVILLSQKWIKGDFPEDPTKPNVNSTTLLPPTGAPCPTRADVGAGFTRVPCVAQTDRGDVFTYTLRLENAGNIPVTEYVLYDVLPFVGDAGVSEILAGFPRKSVWRPALTGPLVPSDTLPSGTVIEYSDSSNSCRPEMNAAPADGAWQPGCINDWTSTPDVWGDVRSFRIKIPFAVPNYYMPGQKMYINVFMRVPNGVPSKTIAWNALAQRATNASTNERLLAAEPPKVGIVVPQQPAIFDLALQKSRANGQPYIVFPNRDVTFTLTITNQGEITASEVSLADYFPDTFTLSPNESNWTGGSGSATRTLSGLNLAPGDSLSVNLILRTSNINVGVYTNTAEIAGSKSITGATLIDVDSTPDSTNDESLDNKNNATGAPGADGLIDALKDDIADEDAKLIPGADEDDHDIATVELVMVAIGNRVWLDAGPGGDMNNGILDTSEITSGVAGVQVQLFNRGDTPGVSTPVSETVTIADGYYQFDRLAPGEYFVHIPITNFVSSGALYRTVSSLGGGTDETDDEDADENGQDVLVAGGYSSNLFNLQPWMESTADIDLSYTGVLTDANVNLTADFAFVPAVAIGNRVWIDDGAGSDNTILNDGMFNGSELGIDAVTVELYRDGNSTAVSTTETNNGGYYYFDMLPPGSYYVQIPANEFGTGQELEGYFSSTSHGSDETTDETDDENGIDNLAPWANGIRTPLYVLRPFTELSSEAQNNYLGDLLDNSVNATADLAFWEPLRLGNRVWIDDGRSSGTSNDGLINGGEVGVGNVVVELLDENNEPVDYLITGLPYTTTTDSNGFYTFTELLPGRYIVRLPETNFATGAPLAGYYSSTPTDASPDDDTTDQDDNGINDATPALNGIETGIVELVVGGESASEVNETDGYKNSNSNLTLDFGLVRHDRGDLPDGPYHTLLANNGADHAITPDLYFGATVDAEEEGQPNDNGDGDDNNGIPDDEDGILFTSLIAGQTAAISLNAHVATAQAYYGAFIDFNGDGIFGAGEIFTGTINDGANTLNVTVPAVVSDTIYSRFRIAINPLEINSPDGLADSGEVEDYLLLSLGNRVWLDNGAGVKADANDGINQPGEQGIAGVTVTLVLSGTNTPIATTTTDATGYYTFTGLNAGEYQVIIADQNFQSGGPLYNYASTLTTEINPDDNGDLNDNGIDESNPATNGVKSNGVTLLPGDEPIGDGNGHHSNLTVDFGFVKYDLGDLPDTDSGVGTDNYTTTVSNDGARHLIIDGAFLGASVDAELDGQPSVGANGDDSSDTPDDEDGVVFNSPIMAGKAASLTVNAAVAGFLNAWIDFNGNGLLEESERIGTVDAPLSVGANLFNFTAPAIVADSLYSRFRFTTNTGEATTASGIATNGEVEDYVLLSLGNQVWFDNGVGNTNDGNFDGNELPVPSGVTMLLVVNGTTNPIATTTTDSTGHYTFTGLSAGDYQVIIAPENFQAGGLLEGYASSSGQDGGDTINDNDNGQDGSNPAVNGISSNAVTLTPDSEPNDDGNDSNSNLTIDFGLVIFDWGDLPEGVSAINSASYTTTAAVGGPNHAIIDGLRLGTVEDREADGQPDSDALSDDTTGSPDDEDGVQLPFVFVEGWTHIVTVTVVNTTGVNALVYGFIDWNGDGDFTDAAETESAIAPGTGDIALTFAVPGVANTTQKLGARFRLSTESGLGANGSANDGEVEDYLIEVIPVVTIGNRLWIEYDGDGDATTGIVFPVVGQVVTATDGTTLYTAVTDSNGLYTITVPANNTYTVTTGLPSGTLDTPTLGGNTGDDPAGNDNKNHDRMATTVVVTTTDNLSIDYGFHLLVDFGDLPNTATATQSPAYSTTWAEGGPSHVINPDLGIGAIEDNEGDGLPNANALGDDSDIDDEDGVSFAPIIAGQSTTVTVSVRNDTPTPATLYGFIDFNGDGTFDDAGESTNETVPGNSTVTSVVLTFTVPVNADGTQLLGARFRISSDEVQTAYGSEPDGEVEDYLVSVVRYDLGDLPENTSGNYATLLANNGPAHTIVTIDNPFLGATEDNEGDGQPTTGANGDDNNGDDEEGVAPFALIPGESADVVVTYNNPQSQNVYLNAWLDVDGNGSLDPIATDQTLASGTGVVTLSVNVPATATIGTSYARFRISSQDQLGLTGVAADGEVEDYAVQITPADYGDLPNSYTTLNADNGARHGIDGVTYLGSQVDADQDGEPSDDADGDDATDERDDEDGVTWPPVLPTNSTANITVTAAITGYLNAWVDFNGNGLFDVATERIGTIDQVLTPGNNVLTVSVPGVITDTLYSRFRFTANPNEATSPSGLAATGEVEDYVRYSLGNRVWLDNGVGGGTADDGARNGSEAGIPNVTVELYHGGQLVATTSTDAQGHYLFTGLADESYVVYIPASNFNNQGDPLYGYSSSTSWTSDDQDENANENGVDDSDPANNGIATDPVTPRLAAGQGNMTVDFAFVAYDRGDLPDSPYATLWSNNGAQHLITPELYLGAGVDAEAEGQPDIHTGLGSNVAGDDQNGTDDEDGVVFMTPLMPGTTATISLTAHVSPSIGTANYGIFIDFNGNGDFNDAGESHTGTITDGITAVNINVPTVVSDTIYARFRIAIDNEGASTDSGVATSGEVEDYLLMSLGNTVWLDNGISGGTANDGALNGGEQGIQDVTVQLYRNGQLIATTTTDAQGHYLFTGLTENDYVVRIAPSNFDTSTDRLFGYSSSTNSANDDQDENVNENGIDNSNPAVNGISSAPITLSVGDEPTADGNNALSNLTVDFAFVAFDWGDLPDSSTAVDSPAYNTNLTDDGPRHLIVPGLGLGVVEDAETNGQSDEFAAGDDNNNDDEESLGTVVTLDFIAGEAVTLTVNVTNTRGVTATLYGFIDFNGDGTFDDPNEVSKLTILGNGSITTALLPFNVPVSANGTQWLGVRLRISSDPSLTADGVAPDGEVEDYLAEIIRYDFGDLPEDTAGTYPTTLANGGAQHVILPVNNPILGAIVDNEADGQPNATATGDDTATSDDEDGVIIPEMVPGRTVDVLVSYSNPQNNPVNFDGWMELDGDGVLEHVANRVQLPPGSGVYTITVTVLQGATRGVGYARFRIGGEGGDFDGSAASGEVEDYAYVIGEVDYGDLPDIYDTLRVDNGPRHTLDDVTFLGVEVDDDVDGAPSIDADGDDTIPDENGDASDDEEGVTWPDVLLPGDIADLEILASTAGYLNAWIDFNGDGDFDDLAERIVVTDTQLITGNNTIPISVPNFITTTLYSRFRFTAVPNQATTPTGLALSGEVEDYVRYALGNTVWLDNGIGGGMANNGALDGTEKGIAGVTVELYRDGDDVGNDAPIATTTTDATGHYLFTGLNAEEYFVYIPSSNFDDVTDPLYEHLSSTGATDDNLDEDVNENGIDSALPDLSGISSNVVNPRLDAGQSNLTVDFAFIAYDFGDLPTSQRTGIYPTLLVNDGPRHIVSPELYFGAQVDTESDGAPDVNTGLGGNPDGDDQIDTNDDEDGIVFKTALMANTTAEIEMTAYVTPGLTAHYATFIDFNNDGAFTSGEIFTGVVSNGINTLLVNVPADVADQVYARFRIAKSLDEIDQPTGEALSGEVEDYVLMSLGNQLWFDNGLGNANDGTFDGNERGVPAGVTVTLVLSSSNTPIAATTTDASGTYTFTGLSAGDYQVIVAAENFQPGGLLEGYQSTLTSESDPNADGEDNDNGIDAADPISTGIRSNPVNLSPGDEPDGNGMSNVSVDFGLIAYDWGDLPEAATAVNSASYSTTAANNGPSHLIISGLYLGNSEDGESDGQAATDAEGDDANGMSADDEDGVQLPSRFMQGTRVLITTTVVNENAQSVFVYAFIDWNGDGDFDDFAESQTDSIDTSGEIVFTFNVPSDADTSKLLGARFRLTSSDDPIATGPASNGEVEDYLIQVIALDLGDLPTGYPTLLIDNGASHVIDPIANPILGLMVDHETDGEPSGAADGDDLLDENDDEDGVTIPALIPGETITVTVVYSNPTGAIVYLNAWLDVDGNFTLDLLDLIATNLPVPVGSGILEIPVAVPVTANPGDVYGRFRISSDMNLAPTGEASDGEVEDHQATIVPLDYGDLPTNNTFYSDNGARHIIGSDFNPILGSQVDADGNGAPSNAADGDDLQDENDDEDGVTIPQLVPGTTVTVSVIYDNPGEGPAYLNAWIDVDGDGDLDPIAMDMPVSFGSGALEIAVNVPATAIPGDVPARFRISSEQGLQPTGLAGNGEVEDYIVTILPLDYGDLPDTTLGGSYPTGIADDGARHVIGGIYLGVGVDDERNGQPSVNADGDDLNPTSPDDEEGVTFRTPIMASTIFTLDVIASSAGFLNAWIDFNGNGLLEAGEQVASSQPVVSGVNTLSLMAPATISDTLYSRFRVTTSEAEATTPTGLATSGEVEDYLLMSLGDTIWADTGMGTTNNGVQDTSEPGIPGVLVELYREGQTPGVDRPIATATTDENGRYLFTGLTPDNYIVSIPASEFATDKPLAGHASSGDVANGVGQDADNDSDDGDDNGVDATTVGGRVSSQPVTLALGSEPTSDGNGTNSNQTVDLGFFIPVSLGNLVWNDINNNGQKDSNESGIAEVMLQLFREGDNPATATPVATDVTDDAGNYLFEGLMPGTYFVYVPTPPAQYPASSTVNDPADNREDGDDNGAQTNFGGPVRSPVIDLSVGAEPSNDGDNTNGDLTVDFGFFTPATLGNLVWEDMDKDGMQDPNEPGVSGITVNLYDKNNVLITTTVTNGAGQYLFSNLPPGDYVVEFVLPPDFVITVPTQGGNGEQDSDVNQTTNRTVLVTIGAGQSNLSFDAGLVRVPTALGDTDEPGLFNRVYLPVVTR